MLMGITRIGNLIINENSFNLLLFFAEAKRRPLRVAGGERQAESS